MEVYLQRVFECLPEALTLIEDIVALLWKVERPKRVFYL